MWLMCWQDVQEYQLYSITKNKYLIETNMTVVFNEMHGFYYF